MASLRKTHGLSGTVEHTTWMSVIDRCENPNCPGYDNYGGRGIKMCLAWRASFEAFLADVGQRPSDKHSLERKDNDGDYEPGNCEWATRAEQNRNTRKTAFYTHNGETLALIDWAKKVGIDYDVLFMRLYRGAPFDKAIVAPVTRKPRNRTEPGASEKHVWYGMVNRCHKPDSPDYPRYGGRGIRVCERWRESFVAFLVDMGPRPSPRHSIDRINNDMGYEPSNCRWATHREQMLNRRCARLITLGGVTKSLSEWSEQLGISRTAVVARIKRGWSDERIVSTPRGNTGPKSTKRGSA